MSSAEPPMNDQIKRPTFSASAETPCYTILDLFSGIGGFSLGLERTGGFKTVAFCEIDPFCRKVLAKHWPTTKIYTDTREVKNVAADVVCGGFPCQDISRAGKMRGLDGEQSGLWFEMCRIIGETKPQFVLAENVARLCADGLAEVLNSLAALGYDAEWHCIPGHAVGSPQVRDRCYIVAYSVQSRFAGRGAGWVGRWISGQKEIGWNCGGGAEKADVQLWSEPGVARVVNGLPDKVHRINKLGNAVIPAIPEMIGRAILSV